MVLTSVNGRGVTVGWVTYWKIMQEQGGEGDKNTKDVKERKKEMIVCGVFRDHY